MPIKKAPQLGRTKPRRDEETFDVDTFIDEAAHAKPKGRQPASGTHRTTIDLPKTLVSRIRHAAVDHETTIKDILLEGAEMWLEKKKS